MVAKRKPMPKVRRRRRYASGGEVDEADAQFKADQNIAKQNPDLYERGGEETGIYSRTSGGGAHQVDKFKATPIPTKETPAWIPQELPSWRGMRKGGPVKKVAKRGRR